MLSKSTLSTIQREPEFIKTIKLGVLKSAILDADNKYYNHEEPTMSDNVYDYIRDYIIEQDPSFVISNKQSESIYVKNSTMVKLPVHMGSMQKENRESKLVMEDVVISDKLDGVSCLIDKRSGKDIKLYTKGNSNYGTDISYLLNFINGIDMRFNGDESKCLVRGELVMKKATFNEIQEHESNPRNTVASCFVNAKTPKDKYKHKVDFIAYEVIETNQHKTPMKPEDQFKYLKSTQFYVVYNEKVDNVQKTILSKRLKARNEASEYEIDGIIVAKNEKYASNKEGNSKHAFAYKENDILFQLQTVVEKVEWNISKDKLLKPTVYVENIKIKNVNITKATGHNARYIFRNKIGKGTKVTIARSGDVIPYIVSVDEPTQADMPTTIKYLWKPSEVDIYVSDEDESQKDTIALKLFQHTLTKLKFPNMGPGTITKLFNANVRTIHEVYNMTLEDIQKLDGFQESSAKKLFGNIQSRKSTITCMDYMVASNCFGEGFGERVLQSIVSKFDPMNTEITQSLTELEDINGIGRKTAQKYLQGLGNFKQFVKSNKLNTVCKTNTNLQKVSDKVAGDKFKGKVILFTSFRDKVLEAKIECEGGEVKKGEVTNKVNIVIYKDKNKAQNKLDKADKKKIQVMSLDDFKEYYNLIL
jgi:NAD-dependent DNA ligase